ncbi:MAG: TlpA disulfide reductase family protein [Flavobacteriaceae bacterium]
MKIIKLLVSIVLFLQVSIVVAQDYSFISKDLHIMDQNEMIVNEVQFTSDILMYDVEGNEIEPSQMNDLMESPNFVPIIYGDKNHEAKAIVFRPATVEEKEAIKKENALDPNANFVPGSFSTYFTAKDINGNEVSLKALRGKVVVLNFWYNDCTSCIADFPALNELVDKYKDVVFVSITFDTNESVKKVLQSNPFNYTTIANSEKILIEYGTLAFPTHLIIDKTGEIVFRKIGTFIEEMDAKIGILSKK